MSRDSCVAIMGYVIEMSLKSCQESVFGLSNVLYTAVLILKLQKCGRHNCRETYEQMRTKLIEN